MVKYIRDQLLNPSVKQYGMIWNQSVKLDAYNAGKFIDNNRETRRNVFGKI